MLIYNLVIWIVLTLLWYRCRIGESSRVKVADFGLSKDMYEKDYYSSTDRKTKLPIKWMALESLENYVFTFKTDVVSSLVSVYCEFIKFCSVLFLNIALIGVILKIVKLKSQWSSRNANSWKLVSLRINAFTVFVINAFVYIILTLKFIFLGLA